MLLLPLNKVFLARTTLKDAPQLIVSTSARLANVVRRFGSRTRQLYGESLFKDIFKQVLKQCIDKGMVAGRRQAMDSAPVKANASMDSLKEKEVLDDGDDYTDELNDNDKAQTNKVSVVRKTAVDHSIISGKPKHTKACPKVNRSPNKRVKNMCGLNL